MQATREGQGGTAPALRVSFFFDCTCPWSYLALGRVQEAALRTGARIEWRPVCAADVLTVANPEYPADRREPNARKALYQAKDLQDWAYYLGLRIRRPARWPVRADAAQRAAVGAVRAGCAGPFLDELFAAYFGEGRDIEDEATILAAAEAAGLDPAAFAAELSSAENAAVLAANAEALVARGGFGVPSFLVGDDDLYFGNDRLPLVEAALARLSDLRLVLPGQHGA